MFPSPKKDSYQKVPFLNSPAPHTDGTMLLLTVSLLYIAIYVKMKYIKQHENKIQIESLLRKKCVALLKFALGRILRSVEQYVQWSKF